MLAAASAQLSRGARSAARRSRRVGLAAIDASSPDGSDGPASRAAATLACTAAVIASDTSPPPPLRPPPEMEEASPTPIEEAERSQSGSTRLAPRAVGSPRAKSATERTVAQKKLRRAGCRPLLPLALLLAERESSSSSRADDAAGTPAAIRTPLSRRAATLLLALPPRNRTGGGSAPSVGAGTPRGGGENPRRDATISQSGERGGARGDEALVVDEVTARIVSAQGSPVHHVGVGRTHVGYHRDGRNRGWL